MTLGQGQNARSGSEAILAHRPPPSRSRRQSLGRTADAAMQAERGDVNEKTGAEAPVFNQSSGDD